MTWTARSVGSDAPAVRGGGAPGSSGLPQFDALFETRFDERGHLMRADPSQTSPAGEHDGDNPVPGSGERTGEPGRDRPAPWSARTGGSLARSDRGDVERRAPTRNATLELLERLEGQLDQLSARVDRRRVPDRRGERDVTAGDPREIARRLHGLEDRLDTLIAISETADPARLRDEMARLGASLDAILDESRAASVNVSELGQFLGALKQRLETGAEPSSAALAAIQSRLEIMSDRLAKSELTPTALSAIGRGYEHLSDRIATIERMIEAQVAPGEVLDRAEEVGARLAASGAREALDGLKGELGAIRDRLDTAEDQASRARMEARLDELAARLSGALEERLGFDASAFDGRLAAFSDHLTREQAASADALQAALASRIEAFGSRRAEVDLEPLAQRFDGLRETLDALAADLAAARERSNDGLAGLRAEIRTVSKAMTAAGARSQEDDEAKWSAMLARLEPFSGPAGEAGRLVEIEAKLDAIRSAIAEPANPASGAGIDDLRADISTLRRELRALPFSDISEAGFTPLLKDVAFKLDRLPLGTPLTADELEAQLDRLASTVRDLALGGGSMQRIEAELAAIHDRLEGGAANVWHAGGAEAATAAVAELARALGNDLGLLQSATSEAERRTREHLHALQNVLEAIATRIMLPHEERTGPAQARAEARQEETSPPRVQPAPGEPGEHRPLRAGEPDARSPMPAAGGNRVATLEPGAEERAASDAKPVAPPPQPAFAPIGLLGRLTPSQLLRRATAGRTESFAPPPEEEKGPDTPLEPGTDVPMLSSLDGAPSSDTFGLSGTEPRRLGSGAPAPAAEARHQALQAGYAVSLAAGPNAAEERSGTDFLAAARQAAQTAAAEVAEAEQSGAGSRSFNPFRRGSDIAQTRHLAVLGGVLAATVALAALLAASEDRTDSLTVARAPAPITASPASASAESRQGSVPAAVLAPVQTARIAMPSQAPAKPDAALAFDRVVVEPQLLSPPAKAVVQEQGADAPAGSPSPEASQIAGGAAPSGDETAAPAISAPADAAAEVAMPPATIGPDALREAAAKGDPAAQFEVASRYAEGRGVAQDFALAVTWYRRAADADLAPAQYRLGSLYEKGSGVARDPQQAVAWYLKAAEAGNAKAMHNLAVLLAEGAAGKPDLAQAATWFRKAAEHGVRDSQFNLAILHARGLGMPVDYAEAYKWFSISARSGDTQAESRRDAIAKALGAADLSRTRATADGFVPLPLDPKSNLVTEPEGGWGSPRLSSAGPASGLIERAQALLTSHGFDVGPADGRSGPKTREAVRSFQKRTGLPVTGVIDADLLSALEDRSA